MDALRRAVRVHPLAAFTVAAFAFSWWSAPLAGGSLLPHGPSLAAVVVLALAEGREGLAELWRRVSRWRVGWRWYLVAPGLVVVYLAAALAVNVLFGAQIAETAHLRSPGAVGAMLLELLLLGGMWEEPGWTGYALPRLQGRYAGRRYGLLLASLHLGALRAAWHLPLAIYGHVPWLDVVLFEMAFQFLITWLFNRSGESVLVVMLFHLASNVFGGRVAVPLFVGVDYTRFYALFVATAWVLALLLVRREGWSMGHARRREAAAPGTRAGPESAI